MVVFKLNRERPAYFTDADVRATSASAAFSPLSSSLASALLYYYKDGFVYEANMTAGKERPIITVRRSACACACGLSSQWRRGVSLRLPPAFASVAC